MSDPRLDQRTGACFSWERMEEIDAEMNGETPETWQEYEEIEELVANGDLCSTDGEPCDWEKVREEYGADRDGNRGIWQTFKHCRKCGEER